MKKPSPSIILFDMDGVIVDSMPYHFLAWYETLRPLGIRVSCFDVYAKEGEHWETSLVDFLKRAGIQPTKKLMAKIFAQRARIFKKIYKRFLFHDVDAFLFCLKRKGYRLGLVSGTPLAQIQKILPYKIRNVFDCIVGGDMVKNGKPSPEPYRKAAEIIEAKPSQCVVIENAPLGIQSAKKAKMFCFAVTTSLPKEYLTQADVVVDRLEDILTMIGEPTCIPNHAQRGR